MPDKAVDFHKQRGVNCAQAVLKGFQERLGLSEDQIDQASVWGGGKAPEGTCGALYAASRLLDERQIGELSEDFMQQAGSTKCREIRTINKLKCSQCVQLAAEKVVKVESVCG